MSLGTNNEDLSLAILRLTEELKRIEGLTPEKALTDLHWFMQQWSEERYSASWLRGLEEHLSVWAQAILDGTAGSPEDISLALQMRALARRAGRWARLEDEHGNQR